MPVNDFEWLGSMLCAVCVGTSSYIVLSIKAQPRIPSKAYGLQEDTNTRFYSEEADKVDPECPICMEVTD